jgi:predicted nucleic-acid-binding protein
MMILIEDDLYSDDRAERQDATRIYLQHLVKKQIKRKGIASSIVYDLERLQSRDVKIFDSTHIQIQLSNTKRITVDVPDIIAQNLSFYSKKKAPFDRIFDAIKLKKVMNKRGTSQYSSKR